MRVALVSHYMPPHIGGVEQVAELLARVYADAGHDVTWVACATPRDPSDDRDGGIRRVRIPANNTLERCFAMPFPVPSPTGWRMIARVVEEADVVHLHDCLYLTSVAADRAAARHGVPMLVTQHVAMVSFGGGVVDPFLATAYRVIGARVLRRARHVAFVGESVREWFARHVTADLRASIVPNAVDTSGFLPAAPEQRVAARDALGVPRDAAVVLFAGRLVPKKRLRQLVAALPPDAHLLAVGDGPERTALADLAGRVTRVPQLPHERMSEAYAAADVFALPSYGEGLPISLIEALSSGLICVVSDDPAFAPLAGCRAVIRSAIGSLSGALTEALRTSTSLRAARGAAGRAFVEERYGVQTFGERYLALLTDCASGGARER